MSTIGKIIVGIVIAAVLFWVYAVPPIIAWWEVNWYWVVIGFVIIASVGGFLFFRWLLGTSSTPVYRSSTKTSYSSDPTITHRNLTEEETITATSLSFFNSIVHEIESFKPFRKYQYENLYQVELASYLRTKFPHTTIEEQRGLSRPDIVIDDIAIEIKGPTRYRDLRTVADKLMRYEEHFKAGLIVVLFDLNVEDRLYDEWYRNITRKWPEVKVLVN